MHQTLCPINGMICPRCLSVNASSAPTGLAPTRVYKPCPDDDAGRSYGVPDDPPCAHPTTVTDHLLGVVAFVAAGGAGVLVWSLVREGRGRATSARLLRRLTALSTLIVLGTVGFVRPWYWGLVIAAAVISAFGALRVLLRDLESRSAPAGRGAVAVAAAALVVASGLVTLGGTAAAVDGAALVGGKAVPVVHDGQVLAHPVLYQVFWGRAWERPTPTPALAQAATFERALPTSQWASALVGAGFGVGSVHSGGCWIDPSAPASSAPASSTASGAFPDELHRAFGGTAPLEPCPGFTTVRTPRTLPPDAVVALWLDPGVPYQLGGVSAHGSVPWPGRPDGLVTAALTGGFARWGRSSCAGTRACAVVPGFASPTYALSHELVEALTNPFGHGWFADVPLRFAARALLQHGPTSLLGPAPAFEGEVADLCEPGQPAAPRRDPGTTLGSLHFPVADFYVPGKGCIS
jgi:hypothetical protein